VRKYDYETGRFTSTDVLWEKYAGWSPYHYCGNNPVSRADWNGKDMVILLDKNERVGHLAIMIGDNKNGWTYFAKGDFGKTGGSVLLGADVDNAIYEFDTFNDFKEGTASKEINGKNGVADKSGRYKNNIGKAKKITDRYNEAVWIDTNPEQDNIAKKAAKNSIYTTYNLITNSCVDVPSDALESIGLQSGKKYLGLFEYGVNATPWGRFHQIADQNNVKPFKLNSGD